MPSSQARHKRTANDVQMLWFCVVATIIYVVHSGGVGVASVRIPPSLRKRRVKMLKLFNAGGTLDLASLLYPITFVLNTLWTVKTS